MNVCMSPNIESTIFQSECLIAEGDVVFTLESQTFDRYFEVLLGPFWVLLVTSNN